MEINLTFVLQIINGVASIVFLKHYLVKPILDNVRTKIDNIKALDISIANEAEKCKKVSDLRLLELNLFRNKIKPLIYAKEQVLIRANFNTDNTKQIKMPKSFDKNVESIENVSSKTYEKIIKMIYDS